MSTASRAIRLWLPRQTRTSDDAGITILKCTLPQVPRKFAPYDLATNGRERPSYLPSLTYFCIQALLDYPDQVHTLGPLRLTYRLPENPEAHDILRELIPSYRQGQPLDLMQVDPRLWAVLIQLYNDLPAQLGVYTLPLADRHLLSLQRIPPTASFALVTILELPGCMELTDENVVLLKDLHSLCAFDASGTALSAWSVKTLAKTLTIAEEVAGTGPGVYRRGPWGLRILSLRNCMNVNNEVFDCLAMFPLLSVVDVRGTRCRSTSRAVPFQPCEHVELFYPTTPSKVLLALDTLVAGERCSLFSHPKPYILEVRGLDYGRSSVFPQPTGAIRPASDAASIGSRQDVFLLSPRYRQRTEATGAFLNRLTPRNSCSCLGCANHGPCERPDTMIDAASEEVLLEARRNSARRFYEQPESGPHVPAATRPSSRARACKPVDKPFMLYRSPPSWSSLPSLDLLKTNADDTERKKVKLDAPLADGRTLSTDGIRERGEVKAAVTALHTSLKERQGLLAAMNASQSVSTGAETERRISSNPFARSAKTTGKAKMHSECQRPAVGLTTPLSKKASGSRLDLTPAPLEASTPKVKPLKPISQLRVPPPPPQVVACRSLPHNRSTQQSPKHPGTKSSQTTITPSSLADSQRRASGGSATKGSTSKPKGGPVPQSPSSKGKLVSAVKPKSGTFDWTAWGTQTSNGDSARR